MCVAHKTSKNVFPEMQKYVEYPLLQPPLKVGEVKEKVMKLVPEAV